jgi:hypothetical protein
MNPPPSSQRLLTIPLAIPAYWRLDEALAVIELLDDFRQLIRAHYGIEVIDEAREQHPSGSDSQPKRTRP